MESIDSKKRPFLSDETLMSKIFLIREKKVMLDRDLANLYDVKAIRLREQVKRNINRFPEHFMFRLTIMEADFLVSQNAIPSIQHLGGHLPYVYTEYGILMLANVLKSDSAIQMSIRIIEVFVKIREMLSLHKEIVLRIEEIEKKILDHDEKVFQIYEFIKRLNESKQDEHDLKTRRRIGYKRTNEP